MIDCNRRWFEYTGQVPSEATGYGWMKAICPDDVTLVLQRMLSADANSEIYEGEYRLRRGSDGSYRWHLARSLPVKDENGKVLHWLGSAIDISDRKRAEAEKLELERRLLHAQKLESIGILAGGIAHDFNNILAGIMGYADLALAQLPPAEAVRADIEAIKHSVRQAADLTRQILAYAGKGKFITERLDLSRVVEDSKRMLAASVSKKAALRFDLACDLPVIEADASQMAQVLMNLVINASEALGEQGGEIVVSTRALQCESKDLAGMTLGQDLPQGRYVCLEVADTGCGMDQHTLARIFDPFFTTKFMGPGIGSGGGPWHRARPQGGDPDIQRAGQGNDLPRVLSGKWSRSPCRAKRTRDGPRAQQRHGPGRGRRGDNPQIDAANARTLRVLGPAGRRRTGGRPVVPRTSARGELRTPGPDHARPRRRGDLPRTSPHSPDVRVVLSSGYSKETATERFAGQGLAGFIQKPYQLGALIARIQEVLASVQPQKSS